MPDGYSVGNLELDITALDKSATSLNNVISRLQSMLNLVSPISANLKTLRTDMGAISRLKFGSFDRLATGLNSLSKVNTQGLYTKLNSISRILTPLKELSQGMTSIGSVNTFANGLQKITKLDVAGFDAQIKSLTASLRPFLQEITVATPALTAFATAMSAVKGRRTINFKQFDQTSGIGKNFEKSFNIAGILGKIYFIRNYTKQLGQSISNLVQMGVDYAETLNLWQVAMRGNISTAEEFISKMNKAYGIAEETLMRYQATFRNMLSTLGGVSPDTSYALSEYLTQMALDYASLYNTSVDKAMTVFQSVLSGQVRPIRTGSGMDIVDTTIYELYQQLGGTKTMRQLTQTEKRLLRIYAVFQQMENSGAIGDLSKTLNSTANTTRVLSETLKDLGTYIGLLADKYLAPLITKVTAFAITAKNVLQIFANPIIEEKKKELEKYGIEWGNTASGIDGATKSYEEFTGKLLGFDKFRSLSGGDQLGLGIDSSLIEGLSKYDSILGSVTSKAQQLAEQWSSWFIDDKTGKLTTKAKGLFAILSAISTSGIFKLFNASKLSSISKIATFISGIPTPLKIILGIVSVLYSTNEQFRGSINNLVIAIISLVDDALDPFAKIAGVAIEILNRVVNVVSPILTVLADIATAVIELVDNLNLLEPIIYTLLAFKTISWLQGTYTALLPLIAKTEMWFGVLFSAIKQKGLGVLLSQLFTTLKNGIVTAITSIGNLLSKMSPITGALISAAGAFTILDNILNGLEPTARKTVSIISIVVGGLGTILGLILAIKGGLKGGLLGASIAGLGVGALIAGIKGVASANSELQVRKNGGLVEDGLFTMNKGEVMGTFDDGTSIVANNQQIISGIKQGVYQAVSSALQANGSHDDRPIDIYIDGEKVFQATKKNAKRHGLAFAKV